MLTNGFLKNKKNLKFIQKAIMATVGVTTSKELIKKAALDLYDDIQEVVTNLLDDLESRGEIKTKETQKLMKELQEKSDVEKVKITKKLQKDSKSLVNLAKDIILTPLVFANQVANKLTKNKVQKKKKAKRKSKKG